LLPLTSPPPCSTLFPYTTLFRSGSVSIRGWGKQTITPGDRTTAITSAYLGQPHAPHVPRSVIWPAPLLNLSAEIRRYFGYMRSEDRKSTRLNSSHSQISYAVFCL